MNRSRSLSVVVFLTAAFLSVPALTAGTVISGGSADVVVNDVFTLPVSIASVSDAFAFEFDLAFDPAILQLLSVSEGSFLPAAGSTIFVPGAIDNTAGTATGTADTLGGNIPGASGSGVLANFQFQAIRPGTSAVTLSNAILIDSNLSDIPFTAANGSVTVTVGSTVPEPAGLSWIGCLAIAGALVARRSGRPRSELPQHQHGV